MKQNIEIQNPTNTVDTDISVPSTDRSSDDQSTVLNEHDSDIFNFTTDVNTDQDNQMRRQVEMIDLFERSDFSVESLSNLQRKDSEYGKFVSYLDKGELPKSQKEARKLLLQSPDFMLINGLLFHSRIAKSKRAKNLKNYQLVLPAVVVKTVISMYHDSSLGGHGGIQHTIDLIKKKYFFSKLAQKISDYIKSCPACQRRKLTKINTKAGIVAYRTPDSPFQVWQIDIFGPINPISPTGNQYVCTAIDLFSKFVFAEAIPTADTITVSEVLFRMVSQFGVFDTIISDQGSEFISKCFKEVCRLLDINHEYTPSFAHHCLGACERSHRTLAERMTPYIADGKNWQDLLPCILFSMNNTVNASLGYSPFEIVYGRRPNFPLTGHFRQDINTLPNDCHEYVQNLCARLEIIRSEVKEHALTSQIKMVERVNDSLNPLQYAEHDYVYLSKNPTGQGQKLKYRYAGPYIIHKIHSPHMVVLKDPDSQKCLPNPIHINRIKPAYVRQPNPAQYFMDQVKTKIHVNTTTDQNTASDFSETSELSNTTVSHSEINDNDSNDTENDTGKILMNNNSNNATDEQTKKCKGKSIQSPIRKSTRLKKKPARFEDESFTDPGDKTVSSDENRFYKVKRILARKIMDGTMSYLVHFIGEPAQNARWLKESDFDKKTRDLINHRPPPQIL